MSAKRKGYTGKATVFKDHSRPKDAPLSIPANPRRKKRKQTAADRDAQELIWQPCRLCIRDTLAPADCVVLCAKCTQNFIGGNK